jgi:amino acid transporter
MVGVGIFVSPQLVLINSGMSVWVMLSLWVFCAILAFCGALTFADLGK